MSFLLLWLEGPLQSWGTGSKFRSRGTLAFPSRSGVLGLIGNAAGLTDDVQWLRRMSRFGQTVRAYARKGPDGKARFVPLLHDFHMVGGGYSAEDPWEAMMVPGTASGYRAKKIMTGLMTERWYIQDQAFACVVEVPSSEGEFFLRALACPVRQIFLGRRCCPPSAPVGRGLFATEEEALAEAEILADRADRQAVFTVREGAWEDGDEVLTLADVPLAWGESKKYTERKVTLYRR